MFTVSMHTTHTQYVWHTHRKRVGVRERKRELVKNDKRKKMSIIVNSQKKYTKQFQMPQNFRWGKSEVFL